MGGGIGRARGDISDLMWRYAWDIQRFDLSHLRGTYKKDCTRTFPTKGWSLLSGDHALCYMGMLSKWRQLSSFELHLLLLLLLLSANVLL